MVPSDEQKHGNKTAPVPKQPASPVTKFRPSWIMHAKITTEDKKEAVLDSRTG